MLTQIYRDKCGKFVSGPSLQEVRYELEVIENAEDAPNAPEELFLETRVNGAKVSDIDIAMLFHPEQSIKLGWLVWYGTERAQEAFMLFSRPVASTSTYIECIHLGCPQFIKPEAVIHDTKLVIQAISWYLEYGARNPSLIWLSPDEALKPPEFATRPQ